MPASQSGHYQVVKLLFKEHDDISHETQYGVTALMSASQNGHYQEGEETPKKVGGWGNFTPKTRALMICIKIMIILHCLNPVKFIKYH